MLVRKINLAKWRTCVSNTYHEIPADAITICMKTSQNRLSVWHIKTDDELKGAVLALAATFDRLDAIDVVVLEEDRLSESGLTIEQTDSYTPVRNLAHTHRDICNLTYSKLGLVAGFILERVQGDEVYRFTRTQLKQLVSDAIRQGLVDRQDLSEKVRQSLG